METVLESDIMAYDDKANRFRRREAVGMEELVSRYIREMKLASGLNRQRVFAAWNEASGAARYTVSMFFRNGCLYCTIGSSMVRNQLHFQKESILERINVLLSQDELFTSPKEDGPYVKELILR